MATLTARAPSRAGKLEVAVVVVLAAVAYGLPGFAWVSHLTGWGSSAPAPIAGKGFVTLGGCGHYIITADNRTTGRWTPRAPVPAWFTTPGNYSVAVQAAQATIHTLDGSCHKNPQERTCVVMEASSSRCTCPKP